MVHAVIATIVFTRTVVGEVFAQVNNPAKKVEQLGNVSAEDPRQTQHFLTLSVFHEGRCFTMARYHDFDWNERGPLALAKFLGLPLIGMIEREPRERLTKAQLIALAVP